MPRTEPSTELLENIFWHYPAQLGEIDSELSPQAIAPEKLPSPVNPFEWYDPKKEYRISPDALPHQMLIMTYRSGEPISGKSPEWFAIRAAEAIPRAINEIISNYESPAEYIRKDFEQIAGRREFKNQVPMFELMPPKYAVPHDSLVFPYLRRRIIWFLTTLCTENMGLFFSSKAFRSWFEEDCWEGSERLLKAIKIDPCFLQTQIGLTCLKTFSLWNKEELSRLVNALKNPRERKSGAFGVKHAVAVKKALLVLKAIVPEEIQKTSDSILLQLFQSNGYLSRAYNLEAFKKLRGSIISKSQK